MTGLSRRHVLTGAAAASAATALAPLASSPASAAAPLATAQAPGWYRYNVGSYQITVATDGKRSFKLPDHRSCSTPRKTGERAARATWKRYDDDPCIADRHQHRVETIVDTGVGEANFERSKGVSVSSSPTKAAGIDRDMSMPS